MALRIRTIRVEQLEQPLGLDAERPEFSWQFESDEPGMRQASVRLLVGTAPGAADLWDSGVLETGCSTGLRYAGAPLPAASRCEVTLEAAAADGRTARGTTWFETGLMDPSPAAWDGAEWIGAPELALCADMLGVFAIETTLTLREGTRAGLVFGAHDPRLLDRTKNESFLEGENYFRFVLDTAAQTVEIFRVGYAPGDRADVPFAVLPARNVQTGEPVLLPGSGRGPHTLRVEVTGNCAYTFLDGVRIDESERRILGMSFKAPRQLNPLGDNDVTAYPRLCSIGYYAGEGATAAFDGLRVCNLRAPGRLLAAPDAGAGRVLRGERQETADPSAHGAAMLRHDFTLRAKPVRARLYATARGIYECSLNGRRAGDEYFAPGASQFDRHLMYQTYDVTPYLHEGDNAIGCTLASGWWCDGFSYVVDNYNYWGDQPSFLARLAVEYADGGREVFVTSAADWQYCGEGPVRYAGFFNGERYDARLAPLEAAFSQFGFDGAPLRPAARVEPVPIPERSVIPLPDAPKWPAVNTVQPQLCGSFNAPVHPVETLTARSMSEPAKGVFIYDLGQEIAGVPVLRLHGRRGQKVTVRYGEMLYPALPEYGALAGFMLQANLRDASNTDEYICSGADTEIFSPRFTFHGYRYLEITGPETAPALDEVQSLLLSSVERITGAFECSDPLVNRLVSNVRYSQLSNFISIPTDCPQRNERMGWAGDTHVFCHTALLQSSVRNFYRRNLQAMADLQTPEGRLPCIAPFGGGFGGITYESAMILMVNELYGQYGDLEAVRLYYPCMKKWMSAMERLGFPGTPQTMALGDWLAPDETDGPLIWNAFHCRSARLMQRFAALLGQAEDEAFYAEKAREARAYWNATFVEPGTGRSRRADGTPNDTQGSYAIALSCGVYDEAGRKLAQEHLARKTVEGGYLVRTGFFGTGPLNPMLSEGGRGDLAARLMTQTAYPGWLYPVTQGATTVWERWNSYTREAGFGGNNSMNSFNHYSLGSVLSWLYENVLGIRRLPDAPAYARFELRPETVGFEYARGGIETPCGRVESAWRRRGSTLEYDCRVPENTVAVLRLCGFERELAAGSHHFEFCLSGAEQA